MSSRTRRTVRLYDTTAESVAVPRLSDPKLFRRLSTVMQYKPSCSGRCFQRHLRRDFDDSLVVRSRGNPVSLRDRDSLSKRRLPDGVDELLLDRLQSVTDNASRLRDGRNRRCGPRSRVYPRWLGVGLSVGRVFGGSGGDTPTDSDTYSRYRRLGPLCSRCR